MKRHAQFRIATSRQDLRPRGAEPGPMAYGLEIPAEFRPCLWCDYRFDWIDEQNICPQCGGRQYDPDDPLEEYGA